MFSISSSRNRMMNTFIIINNTHSPNVRDAFPPSKKAFPLPPVYPGTEYTWPLILKKSLLICFEANIHILTQSE